MATVQSQKGQTHLLDGGFRHGLDRVNADGSSSWRCAQAGCKGRVKVTNNTPAAVRDHDHAPEPDRNKALRVVADMRRRAVASVVKPRQIIHLTTN